MIEPVNEGPPNRTQMIADALAEIGDQYSGLRDVIESVCKVLNDIDRRLSAIEGIVRK